MKALGFILATLFWAGAAQAQSLETLNDRALTVRFCPAQCQAVTGHGLTAGKQVQVFERRGGWARVSDFYNRRKLRRTFGRDLPKKPALWVPVGNLTVATAKPAAPKAAPAKKPAGKKAARQTPRVRRIDVVTRIARLRNAPRPQFRPGSQFVASAAAEPGAAPIVPEEQVAVETPTPAEPIVAPIVDTAEAEAPVVEPAPGVETGETASAPSEPATQAMSGEALTWEQVQERLAQQQTTASGDATARAALEAEAEAERAAAARAEAEAQAARDAAAALAARDVAEQAERDAVALAEAKAAREAEEAAAREDARLAEEAEIAAAERAEADADAAGEDARAELDAENEEAAMAAEEAAVEAEETIAAAVQEAVSPNAAPSDDEATASRRAALATEVEAARKELEEAEAAILAATGGAPAPGAPAEEPTYAAAQTTPIQLGNRPSELTKALLDKRLANLPRKATKRAPKETIIALRHYAKALLDSGECNGIAGGGRSAQPGMLFIACNDDPSYQRVFPLKETSW